MVRVLSKLPQAKVVLIPEKPNIKDLTDYVQHGGNLHELIKTAKHYDLTSIRDERVNRLSVFDSVRFHDAYLEANEPKKAYSSGKDWSGNTDLEKAKNVPIGNILQEAGIKVSGKPPQCCCIWHNEKTLSMTWYQQTNSVYCFGCSKWGDAVDVYRQIHNVSFNKAIKDMV
jgi:hypothetical protein